jgi:hypothetical protein
MSQRYEEAVKRWTDKASALLVGKTIKSVRYLTREEYLNLGWHSSPVVLELEDGTLLFPSSDDEGNGAGALFGQGADGSELTFPVIR